MNIKILGSGCSKCKKLEENTRLAVKELGVDATVEKVSELSAIMGYGVMMTPALVINEVVISTGKILSPADIKAKLSQ